MSLYLQECKRHRPNGCAEVYKTLQCPVCLILPCLIILQKISNHLELLKGKHQRFELQLSPSACEASHEAQVAWSCMNRAVCCQRASSNSNPIRQVKVIVRSLFIPSSFCCAVDLDDKTMTENDLKLPRAKELARLVFGEDLEALAGLTGFSSHPCS